MSVSLNSLINVQVGYITRGMGVWDKSFFKDFFSSLLSKKTVYLGKLTHTTTRSMTHTAERNTHFLEKTSFSDFVSRVENRCLSLVGEITEDDFICMDEGDRAKPSAKVMAGLSFVRDGSTGDIVSGYLFHGASIRGIPVILEREDLSRDTKNQVWKSMVERILIHLPHSLLGKPKGTFLLDAYYDIASYLDFLCEKQCHFIIRAKRNRIWIDVKTGKEKKLKDFTEGTHEVRLPGRTCSLFLQVKYNPKFDEPMRVISDSNNSRNTETYFKRREIEQVFKTMKQEFDLERVRVLSLKVLDNTVAIIQLAVALSNALFNTRNEKNDFRRTSLFVDIRKFESEYRRFAKRGSLTLNRNSIYYLHFRSPQNLL